MPFSSRTDTSVEVRPCTRRRSEATRERLSGLYRWQGDKGTCTFQLRLLLVATPNLRRSVSPDVPNTANTNRIHSAVVCLVAVQSWQLRRCRTVSWRRPVAAAKSWRSSGRRVVAGLGACAWAAAEAMTVARRSRAKVSSTASWIEALAAVACLLARGFGCELVRGLAEYEGRACRQLRDYRKLASDRGTGKHNGASLKLGLILAADDPEAGHRRNRPESPSFRLYLAQV